MESSQAAAGRPGAEANAGAGDAGQPPQAPATAEEALQRGMMLVTCPCGLTLAFPAGATLVCCSVCGQHLELRLAPSPEEHKQQVRRALERWMVREAVGLELDLWLSGRELFTEGADTLVGRFYHTLCEFPLFENKSTGIDAALKDFFTFLPKLEERLVKLGSKRKTIRARFTNYIAGPIFYNSFADSTSGAGDLSNTRSGVNQATKAQLVSLLREFEKPHGAATILEALESAHSIAEIPGPLGRIRAALVESSIVNLEHSLAKPSSRSKIKSLYHITPRRAILKLMRMNLGTGLATSATNLFLLKPFGRHSLMQRMVSTTLGVREAERMAQYAATQLSPEIIARCVAFIKHHAGDESSDVHVSQDSQLLNMLTNEEVSAEWECPPVPSEQVEALRQACVTWAQTHTSASAGPQTSEIAALTSSDEEDGDVDVDDNEVDFEISEKGQVAARSPPKDEARKRASLRRMFKRCDSQLETQQMHPLYFIRLFISEEETAQLGKLVVELLGDESVEHLISVSLPIMQAHLVNGISSRGSGMVPLLEGLFDGWERVLKTHKNGSLSPEDKSLVYREVVEQVLDLAFTLIHNLIRGDRSKIWHKLVHWIVAMWNNSHVDVDTDKLLAELDEPVQALVAAEAELLCKHYDQNATRPLGSPRLDPPALDASWKLVNRFRQRLSEGVFSDTRPGSPEPSANKKQLPRAKCLPKRLQSFNALANDGNMFLTHIEVVRSFEDTTHMADRGYERVPIEIPYSSDAKTWLWLRRSLPGHGTTQDGSILEWMQPITELQIVDATSAETDAELRGRGMTKIAKPLDKRGTVFLWFSRDSTKPPLRNFTAVRRDEFKSELREEALRISGYERLEPLISTSVKSFLGMSSRAVTVSLFVQRASKSSSDSTTTTTPALDAIDSNQATT